LGGPAVGLTRGGGGPAGACGGGGRRPAPGGGPASPTAPKSRSLPGGRVGSTAPATVFGRRATASKAGSRSTTSGAHRLPAQPPLRLLRQPRIRRRCARRHLEIPGVDSASVRADQDGIEGNG